MELKKCILLLALLVPLAAQAQYKGEERPLGDTTLVLTLEDAVKIALSENVSVKVELIGRHIDIPFGVITTMSSGARSVFIMRTISSTSSDVC